MWNSRGHHCNLVIIIIIVNVIFLNRFYTHQPNGADAELIISPLWEPHNLSETAGCGLHSTDDGDNGNATMTLTASLPSATCSLQITATNGSAILIQIPQRLSVTDYAYFERIDCPINRFVRIDLTQEEEESCGIIVHDRQIQLNLLGGNTSLLVSEVPGHNQPMCGSIGYEDSTTSEGNALVSQLCQAKEYKDLYSCVLQDKAGLIDVCEMSFPPDCNATLAYREATFHCSDPNQNKQSLIVYPRETAQLFLNHSRVVGCAVGAFKDLPTLNRLHLENNQLTSLTPGVFSSLDKVRVLRLNWNQLRVLEKGTFDGLGTIGAITMKGNLLTTLPVDILKNNRQLGGFIASYNQLETLSGGLFRSTVNLSSVDLSHNRLAALPSNLFQGKRNLKLLFLAHNNLKHLDGQLFQDLTKLVTLSLGFNRLAHLDRGLLDKAVSIQFLDLSHNLLKQIPIISHLLLNQLHLEGNTIEIANKNDLSGLLPMSDVYVSQPEICICYTPIDINCSTSIPRSPYLTCDRLLSDRILVFVMWLIALSALGGNLFVLWWRNKRHSKYQIQSRLVLNLALSDFLMGVYLIIIASADIYFGEYFPVYAETWRTGFTCRIAGILSVLSSEASVFFVTLISVDRFITIKYPNTTKRFGKKSILVALVCVWIFAGALGIIPALLSSKNTNFYDNSHVCIGIPLTLVTSYSTHSFDTTIAFNSRFFQLDKTLVKTRLIGSQPGMYFATAVFIGLNSLCYIVILACYAELLRVVYKVSKRDGLNQEMKEQLRLTAKVTAIVVTDFLCWCPIIVLGILVQAGALTLPPAIFAWSVTFILPLNSAINPYLYTITDLVNNRHRRRNKKEAEGSADSGQTHAGTIAQSLEMVISKPSESN